MANWQMMTISKVAARAAVTWLHRGDYQEQEELLSKSIAKWPQKTYELAIHIQEAIDEAIIEAFRANNEDK